MRGVDRGVGARDRRIAFERAAVALDGYGTEIETWTLYARAFAEVRYGTGQERREAAQESATLTATFRVPATPRTRALTPKDRILFDGAVWDIRSVAPFERGDVDVTAVRRADG